MGGDAGRRSADADADADARLTNKIKRGDGRVRGREGAAWGKGRENGTARAAVVDNPNHTCPGG